MEKTILINTDIICYNYNNKNYFYNLINNLNELANNNKIIFQSRDKIKINNINRWIINHKYNFEVKLRNEVKELLKYNESNYYIIIGTKNIDFYTAINNKILFINPSWIESEDKAEKYGIKVDNINQLVKFIQSINNQNSWYSEIKVDDITTIFSLMDARYKYYASYENEKTLIMNFESLLKEGTNRNYYDILLYHFLSSINNTNIFDDITIFGIIPSSNCSLNKDMLQFKEHVRIIKNVRENKNILIRHTKKEQAHINNYNRDIYGAEKEFETIQINPCYKDKINRLKKANKLNICIFDDYITKGNTFESIRNLFTYLGANKIICVSLGSFCQKYIKNNYSISGNVYDKNYTYQKIDTNFIPPIINNKSKEEINNLYEIFNSN